MNNVTAMNNKEICNVQVIGGVRGYVDKEGMAWLNTEDVARGFGFTQRKNGVEYIRWDRVNQYLHEFGFVPTSGHGNSPQVGKDDFLPENMVYRLGFKANNSVAQAFQAKLADEILPSIRKYGAYMTPETIEKALLSPDFIIKLATKLKEEQEKNKKLQEVIDDMEPKVEYYNKVANSDELLTVTVIAKAYGLNAQQLNKYLYEKKIQFKVGNTWCLYSKYKDMGLIRIITVPVTRNGYETTYTTMRWTHKGKLFIHNLLVSDGFRVIEEVA